jgi:hypothetical protein
MVVAVRREVDGGPRAKAERQRLQAIEEHASALLSAIREADFGTIQLLEGRDGRIEEKLAFEDRPAFNARWLRSQLLLQVAIPAEKGMCVTSETGCQQQQRCGESGTCKSVPGETQCALADATCAARESCSRIGRCVGVDFALCAPEARPGCDPHECLKTGACELVAGQCQPATQFDCRWSVPCFWDGKCVLKDGACIVDDASCQQSEKCRLEGLCSAVDGACKIASAEDCAAPCERAGRCHFVDGECVATSAKDCEEPCRKYGACHLGTWQARVYGHRRSAKPNVIPVRTAGSDVECRPKETEHCLNSDACKTQGLCRFSDHRGEYCTK